MSSGSRKRQRRRKSFGKSLRGLLVEPFYFIGYVFERSLQVLTPKRRSSKKRSHRKSTQRSKSVGSSSAATATAPRTLESTSSLDVQELKGSPSDPRTSADSTQSLNVSERDTNSAKRPPEKRRRPRVSLVRRTLFWLTYPFYWVWEWLSGIGTLHDRKAVVLGLPALLVGLGCIVTLIIASNVPSSRLVKRYETAAVRAFENEDFERAAIYYKKLCGVEPSEDRFRYMLGLIAAEQGDLPRAVGIMNQLAPFNRSGYGPAHLWLAKTRQEQLDEVKDEDLETYLSTRDAIESHLRFAIQDDPRLWEAKLLLAQLTLTTRPKDAEALLRDVTKEQPRTAMLLASLQQELGRPDDAKATLSEYMPTLLEEMETPGKTSRERVAMADDYVRCLIAQESFGKAHQFVRQKINLLGVENSNIEHSKICYGQAVHLLRQPDEERDIAAVVRHLDDALRYYSGNVAAMQLLTGLLQKDIGEQREIVDSLLDVIVQGRATATTYLVIGNYYSRLGDTRQSMRYYEKASDKVDNPRVLGSIYNNIAWLYLRQDPPEPTLALEWIEKAFATGTRLPEYFDTRGQARVLVGEYEAASEDLQTAVERIALLDQLDSNAERANLLRQLLPTLRAMIRCQQELGDADMQRRYEQLLEELEAQAVRFGLDPTA